MKKKWMAGFPVGVVAILFSSACSPAVDGSNHAAEKPYAVNATAPTLPAGVGTDSSGPFGGGVYGSFPANMCGSDKTFAIISITPSPADPLANDTDVSVTAVIAYSVVNADTVGLVAFDGDGNNTLAQTPGIEEVAIQPGCGQVTVTLSGISTVGYQGFVIAVVGPTRWGGHSDLWETWLTYQVEGEPYVKFTRISHPLDQTLPLVDGRAEIWADYEFNLQGGSFDWNDLYAYSNQSWYGDDVYPVMPPTETHTGTASWSFRPQDCQDDYAIIEFDFGVYGLDGNYYEGYPIVRWMVDVPDIIINDDDFHPGLFMQDPSILTRSLSVENCSSTDRVIHLTDNAAWLYPQAGTVTVPANSSLNVTYSVDGMLPAGLQSGQVTVVSDTGSRMGFSFSANVVAPYTYSVATQPFAWYDDAVTGSGTLIGDGSGCCSVAHISLPFSINVYGATYSEVSVWPYNAAILLGNNEDWFADSFPSSSVPLEIVPISYWYLYPYVGNARVAYAVSGSAPDRKLIVSAYNLVRCCWSGSDTFQVVFSENTPGFDVQYGAISDTNQGGINFGDGVHATTWTPAPNTTFRIQHP